MSKITFYTYITAGPKFAVGITAGEDLFSATYENCELIAWNGDTIFVKKKEARNELVKKINEGELRCVYGTKTELWYLVDAEDRDFATGIKMKLFLEVGADVAKLKYVGCGLTNTGMEEA